MRTIIYGGHVIDPANHVNGKLNLLIEDGKIAWAGTGMPEADRMIDATGKIVAPGFIDIHMHEDPVADGKIQPCIFPMMLRQGVTTAVGGNCGINVYDPAQYLDLVDRDGAAVNVALFAGHEYFRKAAGAADISAGSTEEQKQTMAENIRDALVGGCVGVSFGLRYVPGADKEELLKIMKSLSLVENTNFVPKTTSADMVMSDLDKKRSEYDRIINSEVKMHKLGEAFNWDRESASDAFTVKVTSIKEQSDTSNIPEEYWSWITDYSLIHSDFFDENGQLITPYTRHDIKDSDGVNTQRNEWDSEVDRHFYVVSVEITQNSDKEFDVFGDFSPVVLVKDENDVYHYNGTEDQHGITQSVLYGNVDTVLSTPGDEVNMLHLSKGETRTLTYGIVADDNILDNAYLSFYSRGEDVIDDNAETITISDHSDCVKIKK